MAFFRVKCKNPKCEEYPATPYFTAHQTAPEIKAAMDECKPIQITCQCGFTSVYSREDLGIVADTK